MHPTEIEHGQIYRFLNVSDNRFLDLYMRTTENGTKLFMWDGNTSNAQRFRAEVQDGSFRLLSQCRRKGEPLRVVEQSRKDEGGLVVYADHNGEANQLWILEPVTGLPEGESDAVMIRNKESGKALAHQGYKQQVRCINADPNDVHQQWKLIIAEHDQLGD